MMVWS